MSNAARAAQTPPAAESGPPKADALPDFRFPLEEQPAKTGEGGTAREASAREFPVSTGIAGVSMRLAAGTLRELHWHANAAEWAYVISGNCRVTIYSPSGKGETLDFGPGDVWYFPRGHGHSIQGIGPGDCHFILLFDNGYFSEFATFSFSDWIGHTPREVLAKNLKLPESTLEKLPTKEVYFAKGPVAPPPVRPRRSPPPVHKYRLGQQTPSRFNGGDLRLVSAREFYHQREARDQRDHVGVDAPTDQEAHAGHEQHHEHVAHEVGERAADEHRRARHRQRPEPLDEALLEILGEADAGGERAEHDGLDEDAGHQEVDVVVDAGHLDRAAEDVAEHQHEDDRLDRREHEELRVAAQVQQVAPRHRERVGDRPGRGAQRGAVRSGRRSSACGHAAPGCTSGPGRRVGRLGLRPRPCGR